MQFASLLMTQTEFVATEYPWWLWMSVAVVAMSISIFMYPLSRWLAKRFQLLDRPSERKNHSIPVPYAGGLQVAMAFLLSTVLVIWLPMQAPHIFEGKLLSEFPELLQTLRGRMDLLAAIFAGSCAMFALGLFDDKFGLNSKIKLVVQIASALSVVALGVRAKFFFEGPWVGGAVSLLWIVVITNAFNLLDNMHGLCAGVAIIALGLFAAVAVITGQTGFAVVLLILLGCVIGFLLFNFPSGKTFLGDGGSYFLGFWIACLTITATFYFKDRQMSPLVVGFPLFVMAVPLYDTASVVLIRLSQGRSIFEADRHHLSHRLEAIGLHRTEAVMAIWVLTLAVGLPSVLMYFTSTIGSVIALVQAVLVLGLVMMLERAGGRRDEQ